MRKDLDTLMKNAHLDALLITGPVQHNPDMYYFTGSAHMTGGDLIKKRESRPVLFYNPMERDEAARTDLQTKPLDAYDLRTLLKEYDGDRARALAERYRLMLADIGFTRGRLGIYGQVAIGPIFAVFNELQKMLPDVQIIGESGDSVILRARATKEADEIESIREMGKITTHVVGRVADYLSSHRSKDGVLVGNGGKPLTIGDVKKKINLWLAENGADNPEGTIFAIGHDAGVPHSVGNVDDYLRLGQTIVFDIFPCQAGGGYYYDFTRTWCLGYAPDEALELYETVASVYHQVMSELRVDELCKKYQERTCELFEVKGHPTVRSDPKTKEGYVHGLGHGLGLAVHEAPWFGVTATDDDRLSPGVVVTIEPGLYYPDKGIGCRLEDTVCVMPDGTFEVLAEFSHDLVLPVKK